MKKKKIIKTRFAPSPTGFMHIGNIRTALFSWLYAKKMNGKFFIRIDDTDTSRVKKKYINNVFDSLSWLGLACKEQIIFQSKKNNRYKEMIELLLKKKKAYKCFCSIERLTKLKKIQLNEKKKIRYDEFCKNNISNEVNKPFVVRFNNNVNGSTTFIDKVKGLISISNSETDDFIIAKNNYIPTYNFASAIDDIDMKITDVIRGEDHISNTPKQINIMKAFNADIPNFTHLPLILDKKKNVLSKRNNDISINFYRNNGILPEALLNYVVKLGWSYKNKELFSLDEMISLFEIKNINRSSSIINQEKLFWLNKYYIKKYCTNDLYKLIVPIEKKFSIIYGFGPSIKTLIDFNKCRINTLKEIITTNYELYNENLKIDKNLIEMYFSQNIIAVLYDLYKDFKTISYGWTLENIKISINLLIKRYDITLPKIAIPLRIIIFGENRPVPIYEIVFITGRVLILKKIINIIKKTGAIAQIG